MVKAVLEHNDSILSYGTEDLAQFKDLPQTTTKIGMLFFTSVDLKCVGQTNNYDNDQARPGPPL